MSARLLLAVLLLGLGGALGLPARAAADRIFSIAEFGAKADGTLCTAAINAAVAAAAREGGTVVVPAGTWLTGTVTLRSRVTLHLEPGAVLKGSPDIADYPRHPVALTHENDHHFLILAEDCADIAITGGGVIDGNGPAFWEPPAADSPWWRAKSPRVLPMNELRRCQRVLIEGETLANSPGWTLHPYNCDQMTIRNVRVDNHPFGPNNDGFDIDGCRDLVITGCRLNCGDDGIIIKATPHARSTERVTISDCIVTSTCIGIGIGQETQSGVRQVAIGNCVIYRSHRMIGLGIWDGGVIEDVVISNIVGDTLGHYSLARPIQLEVKQHYGYPATRPLGTIRRVSISNFVCRTQGRCLLTAQPGATIEDIVLRDVQLHVAFLEDCERLVSPDGTTGSSQFANRNPRARLANAAVVLENLSRVSLDGLVVRWPQPGAPNTAKGGPGTAPDHPGRADPPYAAIWARDVRDSAIGVRRLTGSAAGVAATDIADSPATELYR